MKARPDARLASARLGWTLLEGADGPFHAREVTFPLTAEHEVLGPVSGPDDELTLIVSVESASWVWMRRRCCARTGITTRSTRPVSSTSKAAG